MSVGKKNLNKHKTRKFFSKKKSRSTKSKQIIIKKNKKKNNKKSKKNNKKKKFIGGIRYLYCPSKNEIQFVPYNYPIYKNNEIKNIIYQGNQAGGQIIPTECSDFKHNMLERQFGCRQPFWFPKCT